MDNIAIIPNLLSATTVLMTSICNALPSLGSPDDILKILTKHKMSINRISKKASTVINSDVDLSNRIEDKYQEIKAWSKEHKEMALPVIAWSYFVESIVQSEEAAIASNILAIMPIVARSFKDYYLTAH